MVDTQNCLHNHEVFTYINNLPFLSRRECKDCGMVAIRNSLEEGWWVEVWSVPPDNKNKKNVLLNLNQERFYD